MASEKFWRENVEKARKALAEGDYAKALQMVSQIELETIPVKEEPDILLLHAISLYETGNSRQAVRKIKEALAIDPHFAPALDAWGNFLSDEGKFYSAISRYRSAVKANSSLWYPYFHWGYLLKKMGSHKAALRKFNAALARNSEEQELYIHAGDCAFQLNRLQEALNFYRAALQKGETSTGLLSRIGNVYLILGNNEKAVEAYKQSIALDPMDGFGYENWGLLLQKEGKLEDAAAKYEEGLRRAPEHPTLLLRQGELLVQMRKSAEALRPLERALEIFFEKIKEEWGMQWSSILAECAYTLGLAHQNLGEKEKAKEYYLTALRHSPNHQNALAELAALRGIYREHHFAWEFVLEGEIEENKEKARGLRAEKVKGVRAYRIAALNLEEAFQYVRECEEEIHGKLQATDVTNTGQITCYAGILARGPLILLQYRDETR